MILAFELSMPNRGSADGRWSGDGNRYIIIKTFKSQRAIENAIKIRDVGYYHYSWDDGWSARITVTEVNPHSASKLRKISKGFYGYDWMVDTICSHGKPMTSHELNKLSENENGTKVEINTK